MIGAAPALSSSTALSGKVTPPHIELARNVASLPTAGVMPSTRENDRPAPLAGIDRSPVIVAPRIRLLLPETATI